MALIVADDDEGVQRIRMAAETSQELSSLGALKAREMKYSGPIERENATDNPVTQAARTVVEQQVHRTLVRAAGHHGAAAGSRFLIKA